MSSEKYEGFLNEFWNYKQLLVYTSVDCYPFIKELDEKDLIL